MRTCSRAGSAARAALRLVAERRADIYLELPPFASVPPERPEAPALARAQARTASEVTSLRHEQVKLEQPHAAKLLALMDGSGDRPALAADLARIANIDYAQAKRPLTSTCSGSSPSGCWSISSAGRQGGARVRAPALSEPRYVEHVCVNSSHAADRHHDHVGPQAGVAMWARSAPIQSRMAGSPS
jgi:hypothetical protein